MSGLGLGALAAAFAAGFVSFSSPCVFSLIPGYLAFVSGVGFDELGARSRRVVLSTAAFVVGFGAYAGLPLPRALLVERRIEIRSERKSLAMAGAAGVAFALGWTPCIGPTLAAILALASGGSPEQGAVLLGVYSLGLGVPFLVFGLLFTRALGLVRAIRRHGRAVGLASGAVMVVFGVLLASGAPIRLIAQLSQFAGWQI